MTERKRESEGRECRRENHSDRLGIFCSKGVCQVILSLVLCCVVSLFVSSRLHFRLLVSVLLNDIKEKVCVCVGV